MFDKEKDDTIEAASLATVLRWLKFNPSEGELAEYARKFDPIMTNKFRKRDVLIIVNQKMS